MNKIIRNVMTPEIAAFTFSVGATGTTLFSSFLEGTLVNTPNGIQPLRWNISTLVDFLLLDPLVIFCLLLSLKAIRGLGIHLPMRPMCAVTLPLAIASMEMYYYS